MGCQAKTTTMNKTVKMVSKSLLIAAVCFLSSQAFAGSSTAIDNVKLQIQNEIQVPEEVKLSSPQEVKVRFVVEPDGKLEVLSLEGGDQSFLDSISAQLKEITLNQAEGLQEYLFNYTLTFIQL